MNHSTAMMSDESSSSSSGTSSNHHLRTTTTTTTTSSSTTTTAATTITTSASTTATPPPPLSPPSSSPSLSSSSSSAATAATATATATATSNNNNIATHTQPAATSASAQSIDDDGGGGGSDNDDDDDGCRHQSSLSTAAAAAVQHPTHTHPNDPISRAASISISDPDDRMSTAPVTQSAVTTPADNVAADSDPVVAATATTATAAVSPMRSGCIAHQRRMSAAAAESGGVDADADADDYAYARACGGGSDANAWARLTEQQLRDLVQEMAKKMEYTERMNWLCLSSRPKGPPHRKTSLPNHKEVKARFLQICDQTLSDEIKAALRLPTFDSYEWSDEAVLHLMQTMFVDCGFVEKFSIPLPVLREWLYEVYKHYNLVPFHNFRHCFCVAQMMYAMAWHTNLMARLGDLEVLVLLVSCICHDLDHPGYNNIYQINARTELALRYNDISPLENHHCSIAFRLLEHPDCNIFQSFDKEAFREIREGIIRCILATDMARHNDILTQFQEVLPHFDYGNQGHINVFCMILIKVADISNESRPMNIAEPWLERLFQEFFAQSAIEKAEGLPVTPFMDPDKVSKPGSQVRFIGLVLLPLFESLGELLPELNELIIHPVRVAFDYYKCLNDAQIRPRKSHCDVDDSSDGAGSSAGTSSAAAIAAVAAAAAASTTAGSAISTGTGSAAGSGSAGGGSGAQLPRSHSGVSLKSRRSMPSQRSMSKNSVDEPMCISAELHDLPEGSESGDSETATEVEVAEKTSKFKINSEGNNPSRSMLIGSLCGGGGPGSAGGVTSLLAIQSGSGSSNNNNKCSRKESRRKRPSMISEMYTSSFGGVKARGSYGNIHSHHVHSGRCSYGSNRALSLDQYNSRRLSDGVQSAGGGDENAICFNRQHRSLDNEVIGGGSHCSEKYMSSDSCAAMVGGGGGGGINKVQPLGSGCCHAKVVSSLGGSGSSVGKAQQLKGTAKSNGGGGTTSSSSSRTFMSTLRQLKESFHFSFEKDIKKRISGGGGGGVQTVQSRNNNPDTIKATAAGYCCAISAQMHAGGALAADMGGADATAVTVGPHSSRMRACSLDVPVRMWYGNGNGNGNGKAATDAGTTSADSGSRKSSSHEDQHSCRTLSDPLQPGKGGGGGSSLDGDGNRSDGTTSI